MASKDLVRIVGAPIIMGQEARQVYARREFDPKAAAQRGDVEKARYRGSGQAQRYGVDKEHSRPANRARVKSQSGRKY